MLGKSVTQKTPKSKKCSLKSVAFAAQQQQEQHKKMKYLTNSKMK